MNTACPAYLCTATNEHAYPGMYKSDWKAGENEHAYAFRGRRQSTLLTRSKETSGMIRCSNHALQLHDDLVRLWVHAPPDAKFAGPLHLFPAARGIVHDAICLALLEALPERLFARHVHAHAAHQGRIGRGGGLVLVDRVQTRIVHEAKRLSQGPARRKVDRPPCILGAHWSAKVVMAEPGHGRRASWGHRVHRLDEGQHVRRGAARGHHTQPADPIHEAVRRLIQDKAVAIRILKHNGIHDVRRCDVVLLLHQLDAQLLLKSSASVQCGADILHPQVDMARPGPHFGPRTALCSDHFDLGGAGLQPELAGASRRTSRSTTATEGLDEELAASGEVRCLQDNMPEQAEAVRRRLREGQLPAVEPIRHLLWHEEALKYGTQSALDDAHLGSNAADLWPGASRK
mmetsp:Transcript_7134/g.26091  ORF Transcript_7134/g.26091 Transcript_7134/m.26091 type:complete len:402 (-) Transcript_7134:37-1242(-)